MSDTGLHSAVSAEQMKIAFPAPCEQNIRSKKYRRKQVNDWQIKLKVEQPSVIPEDQPHGETQFLRKVVFRRVEPLVHYESCGVEKGVACTGQAEIQSSLRINHRNWNSRAMSSRKTLTTHFLKQHDFSVSQISLYKMKHSKYLQPLLPTTYIFLVMQKVFTCGIVFNNMALRVFSH